MWNMSLSRNRGPGPAGTGVRVLDRAVAVLDAVEDGARTFTELVEATGFSRPTTHRIIKALEAHGYLASAVGYGYRLGPRLLRMGAGAMRELPLRDLAHASLVRLTQITGESAQLYVRAGDRRLCVDAVESESELRTIVDVGADLPLTAGSAGKVFLAWDDETDADRLLAGLEPSGPDAPPSIERFRRQVRAARRQGWAHSSGEREPGVASVSAPVVGSQGDLAAVVSVSAPATRIGRATAKDLAPAVVGAAREIEMALGAG